MLLYPLPHRWMLEVVDHLKMRSCFQNSLEEGQQQEVEEEVAEADHLHWVWLWLEGVEGQSLRNCFWEETWIQRYEVEAQNQQSLQVEVEEMIHKVDKGKNQTGEEVAAFQIGVEVAKIYCLLDVGVRVRSSILEVVVGELPQ